MNIQNNILCTIRIKPFKDKGTADITIIFENISLKELSNIKIELDTIISQENYTKDIQTENNSLVFKIAYEAQEKVSELLKEWILQTKNISLEKKQIFIAKLGGWFDF